MNINFHPHSNHYGRNSCYTAFQGAKSRKFLQEVGQAKTFKNLHATFGEMVAAYKELGYDVVLKRGSHAIIQVDDKINMSLVIPHGSKYVHPNDVKRLHCIIKGEIERAKWI